MPKSILIVDGHPDPDPARFCHALAQAYAEGALAAIKPHWQQGNFYTPDCAALCNLAQFGRDATSSHGSCLRRDPLKRSSYRRQKWPDENRSYGAEGGVDGGREQQ